MIILEKLGGHGPCPLTSSKLPSSESREKEGRLDKETGRVLRSQGSEFYH